MGRKGKQLKQRDNGGGKRLKTPATSTGSTQSQTPLFCLNMLHGKYCLSHCEQEQRAAFADTLHKLSKLTWAQIMTSDRHASGCEIISRDSLKFDLPSTITDDVRILAFRFHGKSPMLGYRNGRTYHVLALDRDFTAYVH